MSHRPHVLVTSRSFATSSVDHRVVLEQAGADVTFGDTHHDLEALAQVLPQVTHWIAGAAPVTAAHLALAPRLRLVGRYGTGYDAVDLDAARTHRIWVTHTPGANAVAVAEFALTLCLDAWATGDARRQDLSVTTVGVWGLGRIGAALATRLTALGCQVLAHDPYVSDETFLAAGARRATPAQLARDCAVVSLHRPAGEVVVHAEWLSGVTPGLALVNTARSSLVDPEALAAALREGRVVAYRSDVDYLDRSSALAAEDLRELVRVTDHRAAHSQQAVDAASGRVVAQVLAVMTGTRPDDVLVSRGVT